MRLAYDHYGEEGVDLIKRIRQQRDQQQRHRKTTVVDMDDDEEQNGDDEVSANLYERLEKLLSTNPLQAREELQRFMEQYDYHERLVDENQVHLSCSMEFPPVIDLTNVFFQARDYLKLVDGNRALHANNGNQEERQYLELRVKQERSLVDYQINRIRDSQKAEVGFSLSSVQPRMTSAFTGETPLQPKWSMTMGGSTNLIYPDVAKIVKLIGKKQEKQNHPASLFVNLIFQPVPASQIYATVNLSNNQAHQVCFP